MQFIATPHSHHRHRRGARHPVHHPELPAQGPSSTTAGPASCPSPTVVLGLDLQGGSHLLLPGQPRPRSSTERIKSLRRDVRTALTNATASANLITDRRQSS